jgi:outer membrane protein OmpA-like peptidoglycan-associated protein
MSDSNKDSKKAGFFSSLGFLAAGMAVAAGAYFLAKPVHQPETTTKEAVVQTLAIDTTETKTVENTHKSEAHAVIQVPEKNITANDVTPVPAAYQSDAQIFFAVSQSTLSVDAQKSLAVVVDKMKANTTTKAFLSGYTDATGNKIQNELLAKERAKSVRNFLRKAGINDERIEMLKPETLVGSSNTDVARRVEVTVK